MAKKSKSLNLLYLVGMVLVVVGFCLPLFFMKNPINGKIVAGKTTGWNFINFDRDVVTSLGALFIFIGGAAGVVFSFLKLNKARLLKFLTLLLILVGAILIFVAFNNSAISQLVGKGALKHAFVGLYMIVAGWVIGLIGWL